MKKILVATDFSDASRNALKYALEMANSFNACIILSTTYNEIPLPALEAHIISSEKEFKKFAQERLDKEVEIFDPRKRIITETYCGKGEPGRAILRAVKVVEPDLVITGVKSNGGGLWKLFGNTSATLAGKINVPMIVIPDRAKYAPLTSIALATEQDITADMDKGPLGKLRAIALKYHTKLYLVRVTQNSFEKAQRINNCPPRLNSMMKDLNPVYEYIYGNNIPLALTKFINVYNISMLALQPHKRSSIERWFVKSITRSMIFETHIPLLILPELKYTSRRFESKKAVIKEEAGEIVR
jgi:nucleotide-binding universal stress UspA family protein